MKQVKNVMALIAVMLMAGAAGLFAEKTPINDLYRYKLENGLELFVAEDHSVPLAYIEIAVRAGATTQTPETAGLFHLYEHMMFKGNELYPNAAAIQRAIRNIGVSNWNAYTEIDCVHYYFTLPSDQLENGMAFWNAAIRSPLMEEKEFENEKKVVLSEIQGDSGHSTSYISGYINSTLFPDAPYRFDTAGAVKVVENATVAQMRDMQSKFYIPSNAALFVGGDVTPEEAFDMADKIFGTWSNNGNAAPELPPQPSMNPLQETTKAAAVLNTDATGRYYDIIFRAPDLGFDEKDSYIAAYIANLLNGEKEDFLKNMLALTRYEFTNGDDIQVSYNPRRSGSTFTIQIDPAYMDDYLVDEVLKKQIPAVVSKKYAFTPEKKQLIVNRMKAGRLRNTQSAEDLLSSLRSWWAISSADYYFNYYDNIMKVTRDDAVEWVKKYITGKNPLILCTTTTGDYERVKRNIAYNVGPAAAAAYTIEEHVSGFNIIKKNKDSVWYKNKKFEPDMAKVAKETAVPQKTKIFVPSQDFSASKKYMSYEPPKVDTRTLKNNIPVYFLHDEDKRVNYVHIGVRGGHTYLESPEYSGLEEALFELMTISSRVYNQETRRVLTSDTRSSFYANTYRDGSIYSLGTTDLFIKEALPIYLDGFMNPSYTSGLYTTGLYKAVSNCIQKDITPAKSDPMEFLDSKVEEELSKNHPYEKSNTMTKTSYDFFTDGNGLKKWEKAAQTLYNDIIRPENIFVVASGNINADYLMGELEKTLGTIAPRSSKTSKDKKLNKKKNRDNKEMQTELAGVVPPYTVTGEDEVFALNTIPEDTGHAVYIVSAPAESDPDYLPSVIAASMYKDLLYNVVREHYGVCYTPGSYVTGGKASLGVTSLYRMSDLKHFASHVREARDYLAQGKLIDSIDKNGKYELSSVEKHLQSYKNAQIIASYSSQATVQDMGATIVYNLLAYNEPFHNSNFSSLIHDISAKDVVDVFKKYWVDAPGKWFVATNEIDTDIVDFD